MTKTIRRSSLLSQQETQIPRYAWNSPEVREGDTIYVRTYAGPIVRLRVKEVKNTSYIGIVIPEDNERTYLAGCEPVSDTQICVFPPSRKVTKKEYEDEDWRAWVIRSERKKKSKE